jgi:hypothetical protein
MKALTGLVHSLSTRLRDESLDTARKTAAAIGAGLLVGGALSVMFADEDSAVPDEREPVRDISIVPKVSQEVAEQHRDERYEKIASISDVLALPTQFSQAEALHVLAGRSDSAAIQGLVFEAARIVDGLDRKRALDVLFSRLTEIDTQSALALARTDAFVNDKRIEQTVWQTLGRLDLDEAISLALAQTTHARQNLAAQSLFATFGYMGNATTDRIEAELGTAPDRVTRSRYLELLADRSVAEAIEFINSLDNASEQQTLTTTLANYLAQQDPDRALSYADLFDKGAHRNNFRSLILTAQARANPTVILDRLVSTGALGIDPGQIYAAFTSVAESDMDRAMEYYGLLDPGELKQGLAGQIAARLARDDIDEAVAWARGQQTGTFPMAMMAVIREIADIDATQAIEIILAEQNMNTQRFLMQNFVQTVAMQDPQLALAYLDQVPAGQQRLQMAQSAIGMWMRTDPDGALNWILGQDESMSLPLLSQSMSVLVRSDVRRAMQILPKLPPDLAREWNYDIAQRLTASGAHAEAMSFVSQFEGQEGYDQLQSAIIAGMASKDPVAARQMADQLSDAGARDMAYVNIIGQQAMINPAEAASWLSAISEDSRRNMAISNLIGMWSQRDPNAAIEFVRRLPAGETRDTAIARMVHNWQTIGPAEQELIDSIEDPELRGQANMSQVYTLMRTNPARARELIDELNLTEEQRQQLESTMERMRMYR